MATPERPDPQFFAEPADLARWFADHHQDRTELVVGFWKVGTGRPSVTWAEAVREALCVGWIDGIGRRIDDEAHSVRFTPRRARSTWSKVNTKAFEELRAEGRVQPAGEAAFLARSEDRSSTYSYESADAPVLEAAHEAAFRAAPDAWAWFADQAPSYRRAAVHWVSSAKRPETRQRRLDQLIGDSAAGKRLRHLTRPGDR